MAKLTLNDITSGFASTTLLNANNTLIEQALENTLSRDGSTPNTMGAQLDMNSNRIINLAEPQSDSDAARLADITEGVQGSFEATSTTSISIATGTKVFTIGTGKFFKVGSFVLIASDADETNYMHGQITGYSDTTLTVNVTTTGGGGTFADWVITISGVKGAAGANGPLSGPGSSTDNAVARFNGAAGTTIQNSGVIISDTNAVTGVASLQIGSGVVVDQFIDEDSFATNSAVKVPTQQSVKAYVDAMIPNGYISGLYATSATYSSSTVANFTLTNGAATDSTNGSFLKATGLSWNITNGNAANGYQGGTTLPNSSTIHFYVIALAADTSWTATFASTSLTPTLPGSYTKYRRVFSLRTNSSGVLLAGTWTERGGGRLAYRLATPVLDINTTNPGTSQVTTALASVPTGLILTSILNVAMNSGSSTGTLIVQPLTQSNLAPSNAAAPGGTINIGAASQVAHAPELTIDTDTSAQIAYRSSNASATCVVMATVLGWEDSRV